MDKIILDSYLTHPSLTGVLSLLFLLGIWKISLYTIKFMNFGEKLIIKYCSFYTHLGLIATITLIITKHGYLNSFIYTIFLQTICILGLYYIFKNLKYFVFKNIKSYLNNFFLESGSLISIVVLLLFVSYFILSITPVTDADSLDYHIGLPLYFLQNNDLIFNTDWKHSRVIGLGELLNLIGLKLKTDNISSVLNFISLIFLISIFYKYDQDSKINNFLVIAIISIPMLLQLIPSQKPQFYGICALIIPILYAFKNDELKIYENVFLLGSIFFAVSLKYSFYVSGLILIILFVIKFWRYKYLNLTICTIFYFIYLFPMHMLKYSNFGDPIAPMGNFLFNNGFAEEQMFLEFSGGQDGYHMPLGLLIPKSLGNLTTIIGIAFLYPLFVKKLKNESKNYLYLSFILFIIIYLFGQNVSRSYFEPLILFIIGVVLSINFKNKYIYLANGILYFQLLFVFVSQIVGLYVLSPSLISHDLRKKVMKNVAHNFSVMEWADKMIPLNSCIITDFRSNALIPRDFVTRGYILLFNEYDNSEIFKNCYKYDSIYFLTKLSRSDINRSWDGHIKLHGKKEHPLAKYIIYPLHAKNTFYSEYRNPLNKSKYSGYIYKLNKKLLKKEI